MDKLIYIADDEPNIRNLVKGFLEKEGYTVEAFPEGESLLAALKLKAPDLEIGRASCRERVYVLV